MLEDRWCVATRDHGSDMTASCAFALCPIRTSGLKCDPSALHPQRRLFRFVRRCSLLRSQQPSLTEESMSRGWIVAFASSKGGPGKTTCAICLGTEFVLAGH